MQIEGLCVHTDIIKSVVHEGNGATDINIIEGGIHLEMINTSLLRVSKRILNDGNVLSDIVTLVLVHQWKVDATEFIFFVRHVSEFVGLAASLPTLAVET